MSATAYDAPGRGAVRVTTTREPKLFEIAFTLGANGDPAGAAFALLKKTDVNMSLTRTGAGLMTLVVPAFPPTCQLRIGFSAIQAAPTVVGVAVLTQVNSTGTLTLRFYGNAIGTPVDFTAGDQLQVWAWIDSKPDT